MAALEEKQGTMCKGKCCQPKTSDSEGRLGYFGRGLFGGNKHVTDEETIDIISLEVEKIRGIMKMAAGAMPTAKRDMLGIALKEKEIQLLMLRESQAVRMEEEKAQKLEKEAKAAEAEEAKRLEEGLLISTGGVKPVKVEPPKISQLIKE